MTRLALPRLALLGVAVAVFCAACGAGGGPGSHQRLDVSEVEAAIAASQRRRTPNLQVGKADCPRDVLAETGASFECSLAIEGTQAGFVVRLGEVTGGTARYEIRPSRAILDVTGVVAFLKGRLEGPWQQAEVNCGTARAVVVDVNQALDCLVTNGQAIRAVQAVVEDLDGSFTVREVGATSG